MIRRIAIIMFVSAGASYAGVWAWSRAWEGVLGGWSIRAGSIVLAHHGIDYDLVLSIGEVPDRGWRPWGFAKFGGFGFTLGRGFASFCVPFFFPVVAVAAYPLFVFIRGWLRKSRILDRQLRGVCTACEYDLTGLREPRCPECSAEIPVTTLSARMVTIRRRREVVVLFVCLGIGHIMLYRGMMLAIRLMSPQSVGATFLILGFYEWFVSDAVTGGVVGLCWCSFGVPLLRRKSVRRVAGPLAWVVGVVACMTAPLVLSAPTIPGLVALGALLLVPTIALAVACLVLRRVIPDAVHPEPGRAGR